MGILTRSILLLYCLISLSNANHSPRIFNTVELVREDVPKDGLAFNINATDPEGDPLTYGISGLSMVYFSVNPATGKVTVQNELDREALPSDETYMKLGLSVYDGFTMTTKEINIILIDANDNKPIFTESAYNRDVEENEGVGTTLFTVFAEDADEGIASVVRYNIDEVIPGDGLHLFAIDASGAVTLAGSLNYTALSTFYRIKINATDGGGLLDGVQVFQSNVAFGFITVIDVPDLDPQFIRLPYTTSVTEHSSVVDSIFQVLAIDQDTGINDHITYSIESATVSRAVALFRISENDGAIFVNTDIDREVVGDVVTLRVKAMETTVNIHGVQASAFAEVRITIEDINDKYPEFYMCGDSAESECIRADNFTGEVFEHSLGNVPINMTVRDMDKGENAEIKLSIGGLYKEVFAVGPSLAFSESVVQLMVKNTQELDFEKTKEMVIQVIAEDVQDSTFRSTATVTIKIKDINDNNPKFPQESYSISVKEHSPNGTVAANITAEDPDTMDEGRLIYRLLPDTMRKYFDVYPDTGVVYVANSRLIDREVTSLYSATLQARDTDNKTGSTVLEITLTDINDNRPEINRNPYLEFVKEGENVDLKIQATDDDEQGTENSQIVFGIVPSKYSDLFTIDPDTGFLTNRNQLDREFLDPELEGKIELNVTATDKGTDPLSTWVTVIIQVDDVNDNTPQFNKTSYKFSVKEGMKGDVGSVHAVDLDQTSDFNRISFSIINGSSRSFIIRTYPEEGGYRGNISVDPDIELDYESAHKNFTMWVEAADLELKSSMVVVEVEVLDVNDERPVFLPTEVVDVDENSTIAGVGWFMAKDRDGDHLLVYEMESTQCRCSNTLSPCNWFLLKKTGEVIVNPNVTVDYELCVQVVMKAQVVDVNTEKGANNSAVSGEMVINIVDINDNVPEFIVPDSVFVVVSESASKATSVASVKATDRDSGIHQQITFEVTSVQFHDSNNQTNDERILFEAVRAPQENEIYIAVIQSLEELDTNLKGKYLVNVTATDTGGLSTTTVLEIFTVDQSYKIELRFDSPVEEVNKNKNEIIRVLTTATKAAVQVMKIRPDTETEESRAQKDTIMELYCVYSNGTALPPEALEKMLSAEHIAVLRQLGLIDIGTVSVEEPKENPLTFFLAGLVSGCIIVLSVLTTSLLCTRRNYRRKLKAAKAMHTVAMTKYKANPVLNLNIDTATDLGFDEENSNADKVSLNSLDYNIDMSEKDSPLTMIIQEEDEDHEEPGYIEPLGAALAQRGAKKGSGKTHVAFDNPAFSGSTTDV